MRQPVKAFLSITIIALFSTKAFAQNVPSSGCMVQQASNAAMQRRLAEIDAAKTNANDFFSGANSCIGPSLLNNLDYSNLIPDASGLLTSGFQKVGQMLLDQAEKQICGVVQNQIQGVVERMNSEVGSYTSSIGGNLSNILGQQQYVQVPSIAGFGSYNLTTPSGMQIIQGLTGKNPAQPINKYQAPIMKYPSNGGGSITSGGLSEMFH